MGKMDFSLLLLKNYLSKGRYFFAHGATLRGNIFIEERIILLQKNYAGVLRRYSLEICKNIWHCFPSTQKLLVQMDHFLSSSTAVPEHFRMRYYIGGSILFNNIVRTPSKILCRLPTKLLSKVKSEKLSFLYFYSKITCPKDGTFSLTGPC